jgi:hypothetical protein
MLSGFFQQPILKASNRNSPFSQKQSNLQSNPSKDETKNKFLWLCDEKKNGMREKVKRLGIKLWREINRKGEENKKTKSGASAIK